MEIPVFNANSVDPDQTSQNDKVILMSTHDIYFHDKIRKKKILKISINTLQRQYNADNFTAVISITQLISGSNFFLNTENYGETRNVSR